VIGVVADDITGAGDVGSLFAIAGLEVVIVPRHAAGEVSGLDVDVLVIDTDSRFDAADAAREKVQRATRALEAVGATYFYKKTCSAFRGNVGVELDAMLDQLGEGFGVALAAFPRQGRTTSGGVHRVRGVPLSESELARDPVHPCRSSDLVAVLAAQTSRHVERLALDRVRAGDASAIAAARARGAAYLLADAETQDDVAAVARLVAGTGARVVLGSSALAEELPRALGLEPARGRAAARAVSRLDAAGGVLVVAGSTMPQTRAQLDALAAAGCPAVTLSWEGAIAAGDARARAIATAVAAADDPLREGATVVLRVDAAPDAVDRAQRAGAEIGLAPAEVGRRVSSALAEAASRILRERTPLVVLGGDTSAAVCERLGLGPLRVVRAIEPGVPLLEAGGRPVVLKSGSFGGPSFVFDAIGAMRQ
jgi:uncharacterized protein YgbK (DUF1537 family)